MAKNGQFEAKIEISDKKRCYGAILGLLAHREGHFHPGRTWDQSMDQTLLIFLKENEINDACLRWFETTHFF